MGVRNNINIDFELECLNDSIESIEDEIEEKEFYGQTLSELPDELVKLKAHRIYLEGLLT